MIGDEGDYRFTIHGARRCVHEGVAMDDVLRALALPHDARPHRGTPCIRHFVTIGERKITVVTDGQRIVTVAGSRPTPLREQLKALHGPHKRMRRPGWRKRKRW